jgi:hypothetical protein
MPNDYFSLYVSKHNQGQSGRGKLDKKAESNTQRTNDFSNSQKTGEVLSEAKTGGSRLGETLSCMSRCKLVIERHELHLLCQLPRPDHNARDSFMPKLSPQSYRRPTVETFGRCQLGDISTPFDIAFSLLFTWT